MLKEIEILALQCNFSWKISSISTCFSAYREVSAAACCCSGLKNQSRGNNSFQISHLFEFCCFLVCFSPQNPQTHASFREIWKTKLDLPLPGPMLGLLVALTSVLVDVWPLVQEHGPFLT